jgi:hypothetical protein
MENLSWNEATYIAIDTIERITSFALRRLELAALPRVHKSLAHSLESLPGFGTILNHKNTKKANGFPFAFRVLRFESA